MKVTGMTEGLTTRPLPGQTRRSAAHHCGPTEKADHFVYRCYDSEGVLLYIGCTTDVEKRLKGHFAVSAANTASWWLSLFYSDHKIEGPFRGRDAGRDAERAAIRSERPLFNTHHSYYPGRVAKYRVGRYLIAKGYAALAAETTCNCADGLGTRWCATHEGRVA